MEKDWYFGRVCIMKDTVMLSIDSSLHSTGVTVWINAKWHNTFPVNDELWINRYKNTSKVRYPTLRDTTLVATEKMIEMLSDVIDKYNPDIIVIERPVVLKNAKVQSGLDRVVGFIQSRCLFSDIDFQEYRPSEWRALIKSDTKPTKNKKDLWKKWAMSIVPKSVSKHGDDCAESYLLGQAHINLFSNGVDYEEFKDD